MIRLREHIHRLHALQANPFSNKYLQSFASADGLHDTYTSRLGFAWTSASSNGRSQPVRGGSTTTTSGRMSLPIHSGSSISARLHRTAHCPLRSPAHYLWRLAPLRDHLNPLDLPPMRSQPQANCSRVLHVRAGSACENPAYGQFS